MSAGRHVLCMEISLRLWTNHTAPVLNFSNRRTRLRLLNLSASHLFTRSRSAGFLKKISIRDNPLLLTSRPKMFTKSKLADARSRKKNQRYFHKMATLGTEQNKNSPHTQIADICHRRNADYRRSSTSFQRARVCSRPKNVKKKKNLPKRIAARSGTGCPLGSSWRPAAAWCGARWTRSHWARRGRSWGSSCGWTSGACPRTTTAIQQSRFTFISFSVRTFTSPPPFSPVRRYICRHSIRGAKFKLF